MDVYFSLFFEDGNTVGTCWMVVRTVLYQLVLTVLSTDENNSGEF